ncbi:MAG: ATP-binding protein [Methanobrevibacter sp.]|jgi:AAA+ ATPase superfamily predicted ATPase|nr:ATP-binding protein [Methanobrevibacter sp.]
MNELPWGNDAELNDNQFYNRTEEISLLKRLLETTGEHTSPAMLISGIRGVGKTVLLKKIKKELDKDYLVSYVDLTQVYSYQIGKLDENGIMEHFFNSWMSALQRKNLHSFREKIKKILKTKKIKIGEIVDISGYPIPILESENNPKELLDFVINLPQKIYENNSNKIKGVIFIIDEFQALNDLGNNLKGFLWFFRSYIQKQKNVAYVFSGSINSNNKIIEKIAGNNGAFGGRILSVQVDPFTKSTVKSYLDEKVPELKLTENGFERFYKCTKGIPHYVNTFGRILEKDEVLDEEKIKEEFIKVLPLLADHLKQQWGRLTLREQRIIISLIEKPLKRSEIGEKINQKPSSISLPLNNLQNEGFIEINQDNKYEIIEYILKEWLKQEYKSKRVFPHRSS